jgi:uncharacterized protein
MATDRRFDPRRFDVQSFATVGASLAGEWPLVALPRLAASGIASSIAVAPPVAWSARGARRKLANAGLHPALALVADAAIPMQCQRCLEAVDVPLHVGRELFFVEGEDAAAALDEDSEDDVLTLEPAIDLRALIEDELLLALPLIPRHTVCPAPLVQASEDDGAVEPDDHPFAALAALKRGSARD